MLRLVFCIFISLLGASIAAQSINDTLIDAISDSDVHKVLHCMRNNADVNYKTPYDSITPLMFASEKDNEEIVKILLYNGANPNAKPWNGITAIHTAVSNFKFNIAELLIQSNADINVKDNDSITPLMLAAGYNDWMMCDMLIFYGADLDVSTPDGTDALLTASFYGNTKIVELLAEKGASFNVADNKGFTPLHCAAQNGHLETFKFLIQRGLNVEEENAYGNSVIDVAIFNDQLNIMQFLFDTLANSKDDFEISISTKKKAIVNNSDIMRKYLKKKGLHYKWPFFEKIGVNYNNHWNFHDYMMGGSMSIHDVNYNMGFYLGMDARISKKRVLEQYSDYYFQYWEKRNAIVAELRKNWSIQNKYRNQIGFYTGAKVTNTWGKYVGTDIKPETQNLLSPHLGLYWDAYYGGMNIGYEYIDFQIEKISPHKINIEFTVFIHHQRKFNRNNKNINWL